jgi:hypothetical protein
MHSYQSVIHQLEQLGVRPGRLFLGEVRTLPRILLPDENIEMFMSGRYEAGPAILVATNKRLILVDKKPFNLSIEDIPYDMISEVQYSMQAFNAKITIHSISKTVNMMSYRQSMLRRFAGFVQAKVMFIRAHNQLQANPVQQIAYGQYYGVQDTAVNQQNASPQTPVQQYYSEP